MFGIKLILPANFAGREAEELDGADFYERLQKVRWGFWHSSEGQVWSAKTGKKPLWQRPIAAPTGSFSYMLEVSKSLKTRSQSTVSSLSMFEGKRRWSTFSNFQSVAGTPGYSSWLLRGRQTMPTPHRRTSFCLWPLTLQQQGKYVVAEFLHASEESLIFKVVFCSPLIVFHSNVVLYILSVHTTSCLNNSLEKLLLNYNVFLVCVLFQRREYLASVTKGYNFMWENPHNRQ